MKILKKLRTSASGFTLIELLIVIVIIGILAGVLISVINPKAQQDKARDATVKSILNKFALSTGGFIGAVGVIPNEVNFLSALDPTTTTSPAGTCGTATAADCTVAVAGWPLASTCDATGWSGNAAAQCYFRYCGGDDTTPTDGSVAACTASTAGSPVYAYRLFAKSYTSSTLIYMYRSADSKLYACDSSGANCL